MNQTAPRHAYNSDQYSEADHELLELIRHQQSNTPPEPSLLEHAQKQAGTPFDKLMAYAYALDQDGTLSTALHNAHLPQQVFYKLWVFLYFLLGLVSAYGLLYGHLVNFFYLLIALLGWHSVSLVLWLVRPKPSHTLTLITQKLPHFLQTRSSSTLAQTAHAVVWQSHQAKHAWQIAHLTHQAWLFALLGNVLALLLLFLSKSYAFTWESTLLTQAHIVKLVKIIGIVPSWFGLDLPSQAALQAGSDQAAPLARLLMASIVLYGMVPRFLVMLYCYLQCRRQRFAIDGRLYFYDNLLRQFNQTIIDPNDYQPKTPKPAQAVIATGKKIVATLELSPQDNFWYQFGAGTDVVEIGVLDTKSDFARLKQAIDEHRLSVYLGVMVHLLPDRGLVKKLELISQMAQFGMMVELIGQDTPAHTHDFYSQWQQVLASRGIDEVRYY